MSRMVVLPTPLVAKTLAAVLAISSRRRFPAAAPRSCSNATNAALSVAVITWADPGGLTFARLPIVTRLVRECAHRDALVGLCSVKNPPWLPPVGRRPTRQHCPSRTVPPKDINQVFACVERSEAGGDRREGVSARRPILRRRGSVNPLPSHGTEGYSTFAQRVLVQRRDVVSGHRPGGR